MCFRVLLFFISILGIMFIVSCGSDEDPMDTGSEVYQQAVADFYMSLGASQTDEARFAFNKMNDVAQAFPGEPAAWANLAVYAMRQGNFDLAEDRILRALELKPGHAEVLFLASIIESRRGNITQSVDYLRKAVDADPQNLRVLFALSQELEREDDLLHADEIRNLLENLREMAPDNQVVVLELARVAAKDQDRLGTEQYLKTLESFSAQWESENISLLSTISEILEEENYSELSLELSFLRSGLESQPEFQDDLLQIQLPPTDVGFLIPGFLYLPQPEVKVAEPDLEMQLLQEAVDLPEPGSQWIRGVTLLEDAPPFPVAITGGEVVVDENERLPFPGDSEGRLPPNAFVEIDYNYNFRNDIAVAGNRGFKLYHQNSDETFTDITADLGLNSQTLNGNYYGVWAFDVDMDGDLDILLAPSDRAPFVLRNNGDGTFIEADSFRELEAILDFRWADLDGDGVPEAIFLTQNREIVVFRNLRGGEFDEYELIAEGKSALVVADLDANTQFDIIAADSTGEFVRYFFNMRTGTWDSLPVLSSEITADPGSVHLFSADLDNNGALDLIVSTPDATKIWLGDEDRNLVEYQKDLPGGVMALFDVDGNERLDLLGVSEELTPFQLKNSGTKNYFARSIRARASGLEGDQRINSFGIGGEMEVRSGLLYQKQLISSPIVHFGLGHYDEAQMLRIVWPNGSVQAEFAELGMGATIFNEQILKGSCPWLFTSDGEDVHFITDILWRSPLGLRINALETAGVNQTLDRVRIPADKIEAVDGLYDVRITAELWETHFFDYVSLIAVDHPENSEIYIDERFAFEDPDLSSRLVQTPQPVARVSDSFGNDVTATVSELNRQYIKPFKRTAYQGLTKEHTIEIELNELSTGKPQWLLLSGWLRPTDSSINLALSQGSNEPPKGLHVEVSDGEGGWSTLHEDYGFPAGKLKTIMIDLEGAFRDEGDRKVRLTTTTEIYWDAVLQAGKMDDSLLTETKLKPERMELRYRGFSEWKRANEISPKLPDYSVIASTNQRWRDLEGFHTRFGDVSELLEKIDDRYVIMNAGDELVLNFRSIEGPGEGYQRSYVFVSDGWEKDGDYNTETSATVLPLPYHGQTNYGENGPGSLFEDPVFQRFREDWVNFHTRYITAHNFRTALLFED